MALLNFSAPYLATPSPLTTQFYPQPPPLPQPPQQEGPYSYPAPPNPFRGEDYPAGRAGDGAPPQKAPTYTRVQGGGSKTRVHAVIDYDDDYYDDAEGEGGPQAVTPIQGPIFLKNGTVPVVPLYSYPVLNNGSFVQIPVSEWALFLRVI